MYDKQKVFLRQCTQYKNSIQSDHILWLHISPVFESAAVLYQSFANLVTNIVKNNFKLSEWSQGLAKYRHLYNNIVHRSFGQMASEHEVIIFNYDSVQLTIRLIWYFLLKQRLQI